MSGRDVDEIARKKLKILQTLEKHLASGNREIVMQAIEGRIHENTLRNWLKNKEGAIRKYKSDALLQIALDLPSVEDVRTAAVFRFALSELGLKNSSQAELSKYHGGYFLRHNFNLKDVSRLYWLKINANETPTFGAFITTFRHVGNRCMCDGLVLIRPRRLYLLGLSPDACLMAHLEPVKDPTRALIKGLATFESINEERVYISPIVLHQRPPDLLTKEESGAIEEHLHPQG